LRHKPIEHACVGLQTRQLSPRDPQAFGTSPLTHAPFTSQHPLQVDAEHGTAVSQPTKTDEDNAANRREKVRRTGGSEKGLRA
jgi:hypothetical protein